jgi:hypothetical protein
MFHPVRFLLATATLLGLVLVLEGDPTPVAAAPQQKPKEKPKAAPKAAPKPPAARAVRRVTPALGAFWVQTRHPTWRRFPTETRAQALTRQYLLRVEGWTTQIRRTARNGYYVRARMPHWVTRALAAGRAEADREAAVFHALDFQTRLVRVH